MLTKDGIESFYNQYRENLTQAAKATEITLYGNSREEWIENVHKRKEITKELYRRNMELLEAYIYPFLNDEIEMTKELADIYLDCSESFCLDGFIDHVAGIDIMEKVRECYEKNCYREGIIRVCHVMAMYCTNDPSYESTNMASLLIDRELDFLNQYFDFEDDVSRKHIVNALCNNCITYINKFTYMLKKSDDEIYKYQIDLMKCVNKAISFYANEKVLVMNGNEKRIRFNTYIINILVCGNIIGQLNKDAPIYKELLDYTYRNHKKMYDDALNKNPDIYKIGDGLFCNYWICRYRLGDISRQTLVETIFDYCKHCIENEIPDDEEIIDSKYYNVCLVRLPYLLQYTKCDELSEKYANEIIVYSVRAFLDFLKHFPTFGTNARVSHEIEETALILVPYLPHNISPYYFLLRTIINRNESSMLHSVMVKKLSNVILKKVFETEPELLIGLYGTKSVLEVMEKRKQIIDYVRLASMIFDIGKTNYSALLATETRKLTLKELESFEKHTIDGWFMVKRLSDLQPFWDIVVGHHKNYDGKGGVPKDFDNTKSEYRFIIDLIRICDFMDASNNYAAQNMFGKIRFEQALDDLKEGAGTLYNPDIVAIITQNNDLVHNLKEICIDNRDSIYYDRYYDLLVKEKKSIYEKIENDSGLPIWAKGTIRIVEIDFYNDTIKTLYQSKDNKMPTEIDGKFDFFMKQQIKPFVYEKDMYKLQSLLDYGSLAEKLNAQDGTHELELRIKYNEGIRWVRLQFVVESQHYGIPEKLVLSIHDIDEQFRQRQEMIEALERANDEAKQASRAKTLFISNISHEIRTPMNAIIGMVEILLRDAKDERQREYLTNIQTSGNALVSLINDILDFSKMEAGKLEINNVEYEVMSSIADLTMIFLNRIGDKPVELLFDIDKNIPNMFYGDTLRLRQVILNIMNNAIKFTDKGYVKLSSKIQEINGDEVTLLFSVKDTGIGIKKEEIPKLFGAFSQVDIKRNYQQEGTGLGLIISKQLVELMGGKIWIESEYGVGSEFLFTIKQKIVPDAKVMMIRSTTINDRLVRVGALFENKLLRDNVEMLCERYELEFVSMVNNDCIPDFIFTDSKNVSMVHEINKKGTAKVIILQNPLKEIVNDSKALILSKPLYGINFCEVINNDEHVEIVHKSDTYLDFVAPDANILIVDDTAMNLTVAKGLLGPLKMRIDTAEHGKDAVKKVQENVYDLIFMDHKMPVMDGIEATIAIRALDGEYFKTVPIIALTANAVLDARKEFEDAGMNDFVAKPIEMKQICAKLKKWLPEEKIIDKEIEADEVKDDILPDHLDGINLEEALNNTGNASMLTDLLCDYYNLIDVKSTKIRDLLNEGDIKGFTIEVHAMKSVSRMVGALELSDKFKQLESWADAGEVELLYENTPQVLEQYISYKDKLKDFVKSKQKDNLEEISKNELIDILENVCVFMECCDMDMIDMCMDRLKSCKIPETVELQMDKLNLAVTEFAMEDTINISKEMIRILQEGKEG